VNKRTEPRHIVYGLGFILSHGIVTLLAVGIAFALPSMARFILFQWWPQVEADSTLLLVTEIGVASLLVLLANLAKTSWDNRRHVSSAKLASLVHVRSNDSWLSRWRERMLFAKPRIMRDAHVLTVTGFDTFASQASHFRNAISSALEIRVMLVNPNSHGAKQRVSAFPPEKSDFPAFCTEIEASISYLDELRKAGKKVSLKFYDSPPFWRVVVLGEHVWVQYCHSGCDIKSAPEYVFELHPRHPRRGLFVPFYMYFLEKWSEQGHPEFDFHTRELVHRDSAGKELKRTPFQIPRSQH
jgi:hypothetical protein